MRIELDREGSVEQFKEIINKVALRKGVEGLFVLACDENGFTPKSLNHILNQITLPVFGGIFPQIIYGKESLTKGTIIAGLTTKPNVSVISNLSDGRSNFEKIIDQQIPDTEKINTMFVFVDGLSKRISALIDGLFNIFGLEINYIGGGAGSLSFKQSPCLITNQGILEDSALLVTSEIKSGIGVNHGWKKIEGPFKVTESDRNIIKTLDWKPAFQVYRDVVEKHSGKSFSHESFFDIAKSYPFGITRLGTEKIVRDPLMMGKNDTLVCVGEVPKESFVDILSGDANSLIKAAGNALAIAKENCTCDKQNKSILFMDCISRVLFLEDNFSKELKAVAIDDVPLFGALTLGEIANNGKDYLEFYNKTSVVGILEEL